MRLHCNTCGFKRGHHAGCPKRDVWLPEQPKSRRGKRRKRRGRYAARRSYQGSGNPKASLTETDVAAMRAARKAGAKIAVLAVRFGVSVPHVSSICAGKYWGHA